MTIETETFLLSTSISAYAARCGSVSRKTTVA
jgi:hypothetical protein